MRNSNRRSKELRHPEKGANATKGSDPPPPGERGTCTNVTTRMSTKLSVEAYSYTHNPCLDQGEWSKEEGERGIARRIQRIIHE